MRKRLHLKLLIGGLLAILVLFAGIIVWLSLAGAPAPDQVATITIPVTQEAVPEIAALPPPPGASPAPAPQPVPEPSSKNPGKAAAESNDKRPRIAIIITELGPSAVAAQTATQRLPAEVTLAFLPFSNNVGHMIDLAQASGHEILLTVPMEPATFPDDDPGPDALMTSVSDAENLRRLEWDLARAKGYTGVINYMGSKFTVSEERLKPVFSVLRDRHLFFVDTRSNPLTITPALAKDLKLPFAIADQHIDTVAARDAIDESLAKLEEAAKKNGSAVGIAGSYPVTFERLDAWIKTLSAKGIVLAPVSAVVTAPKS